MSKKAIQIHDVVADNDTLKLMYFAGRYLSEQEFDLMQRYVEERCEDLLRTAWPGIVDGLEVSANRTGSDLDLAVQSGIAVGGDGRAIRAFFPIRVAWASLLEAYTVRITAPESSVQPVHGYYFLTLKRQTATIDDSPAADPCARSDLDILRDSRLETVASLDLQFISDRAAWMAMEQQRAASRILVNYLDLDFFDRETGAIPLALLKIENDVLQWVDVRAGRFNSQENAAYQTFFTYWQNIQRALNPPFDRATSLGANLGMDYLPAAGSLPRGIVTDIAGAQLAIDANQWQLPTMQFEPFDLQVELLPVPANTVAGVLNYELQRGVIDLVHGQQDRIRLMVAVAPEDYRAELMDLPAIDFELVDELYHRHVAAASAYNEWANQFHVLYANLDRDATFDGDTPDTETRALFESVFKVVGPTGDFPNISVESRRLNVNIPVAQATPESSTSYMDLLVSERQAGLPETGALPRPYSQAVPAAPTDLEVIDPALDTEPEDGLYRQHADIKAEISAIEDSIDDATLYISEISDFIGVQRQHLDSITVSFAALAGGVPGDGSGLNLMRWSGQISYQPAPEQAEPPG